MHPPHADERKRDFFDAGGAGEPDLVIIAAGERTDRKQRARERESPFVLSMFIWADELLGNILRFAAAALAALVPSSFP